MIYHLPLQTAGIISGALLLVFGFAGLIKPEPLRRFASSLPRSKVAGVVILTIDLLWSFWMLATMEMGEFSSFRRPLLVALPIGFFLVLRFVDEFLAVRALGILLLFAAEPLLEAAFFRYETSRLLVTALAYILIVAGLFWVTMPYLLRDQIGWSTRAPARWRMVHAVAVIYGASILGFALTRY